MRIARHSVAAELVDGVFAVRPEVVVEACTPIGGGLDNERGALVHRICGSLGRVDVRVDAAIERHIRGS